MVGRQRYATNQHCIPDDIPISCSHARPSLLPAAPAPDRPARPVARCLPPVGRAFASAVARAETVAEREITALLAQPDFRELVEALEELQGLPEEERLRRLERHAWCVLEMALADSDWRAAAFVAHQLARGFNPARMLAKGVLKAQARAAAPPPTPAAGPAAPPAARHPALRRRGRRDRPRRGRDTRRYRRRGGPGPCAWPAVDRTHPPAAATSEPTAPAGPAGRTLWPPGCAAAPPAPVTAATDPRGLLRAWAQGPWRSCKSRGSTCRGRRDPGCWPGHAGMLTWP